jgi:ribose/xylose/arabinose/galactoside ABC-type transport system permease subunit
MPRHRATSEFLFLALLLAALVGLFSLLNEHFWSLATLQTITNRIPALALAALGMTFVLIAGGIDLSVGSVSAVAGAVFGWCVADRGVPVVAAAGMALAASLACGLVNGALVNVLRMPSFIVTLGLLEGARGVAYLVTNSQTKYLGERLALLQATPVGGLSVAFLLALILTGVAHFALTRTVFGRHTVAVGTNEEAARLVGHFSGADSRGGVCPVRPARWPRRSVSCGPPRGRGSQRRIGPRIVRDRGGGDWRHQPDGWPRVHDRDVRRRVDHRDT